MSYYKLQQIRYRLIDARNRIARVACVGLLLLTVGCVTKRPQLLPPPLPPMPVAEMRSEVQTATFAEAVIGPPAVKQFRLMWTKGAGADSTEIYATTDTQTWSLLADVTGEEYPFFASGAYRFFKIRSKQVETYSVSNYHTGQWEQIIHTNYSNWAK